MSKEGKKNILSNEHLKFIENVTDKELQSKYYTLYFEYLAKLSIERWHFVKVVALCLTPIACIILIKCLFLSND